VANFIQHVLYDFRRALPRKEKVAVETSEIPPQRRRNKVSKRLRPDSRYPAPRFLKSKKSLTRQANASNKKVDIHGGSFIS
jgi:hypothetical protein